MSPALPKPTRADRRRRYSGGWSGLATPKPAPLRDDDYREHVRQQGRCLLFNFEGACQSYDRAPIEAAHLASGGTSTKASDASPRHHDALDNEVLPWQIVAFLWMKAHELRELWHARRAA